MTGDSAAWPRIDHDNAMPIVLAANFADEHLFGLLNDAADPDRDALDFGTRCRSTW